MRIVLLAALVVLASCQTSTGSKAPISNNGLTAGKPPDPAAMQLEMMRISQLAAESARKAEEECAPIKTREWNAEEEQVLGERASAALIKAQGAVVEAASARATTIGTKLSASSTRPAGPWKFVVVDNPRPSAFSAPGGWVFVTSSLVDTIANDAQLAGVLAHEMAHVTQRHGLVRLRDASYRQCVAGTQVAVMGSMMPGSAGSQKMVEMGRRMARGPVNDAADDFAQVMVDSLMPLLQGGADRDAEFEADALGLKWAIQSGFTPDAYETWLASLPGNSQFLSGFPPTAARVEKLKVVREQTPAPATKGGFSKFPKKK